MAAWEVGCLDRAIADLRSALYSSSASAFLCVTLIIVLAKAEARRVRTVTLSDIEMRRDFQAIITDWRERAKKYLSTYSEYSISISISIASIRDDDDDSLPCGRMWTRKLPGLQAFFVFLSVTHMPSRLRRQDMDDIFDHFFNRALSGPCPVTLRVGLNRLNQLMHYLTIVKADKSSGAHFFRSFVLSPSPFPSIRPFSTYSSQ